MSYNSGGIKLVISNHPRAVSSADLKLLTGLLPELYSTQSNYYCNPGTKNLVSAYQVIAAFQSVLQNVMSCAVEKCRFTSLPLTDLFIIVPTS